jgi:hypothetical protein
MGMLSVLRLACGLVIDGPPYVPTDRR